jgi:G3E family GTPase
VLHTIMSEPTLLQRCRLEGVIAVVDGVNGHATLDAHAEAVKQVAVADRLVLTKLDLLSGLEGEQALFSIIARIKKLAPGARMLTTHRGEATAPRLFNTGLYDPQTKSIDVKGWLNAEAHSRRRHHHRDVSRHDAHIRSFSFTEDRAIGPQGLEMFIELLQSFHGANMLRMKGIVKVSDAPQNPVVLHGVQHVFHPPVRLKGWPDGDERTRLVFIVKDIEQRLVEDLFRAFADQIGGAGAVHLDKTLALN